jgi:hypothetical protein
VDISHLAYLAGYLALPIAGVVMLIAGIVRRSASPPGLPAPAPHPYPTPWQPGQQPQPGYPYAQQPPSYRPPAPQRRAGTGLIVAGAILIAVTMLGSVGRAATNSESDSSAGHISVGDCVTASNLKRSGALKPIDCTDTDATFELAATANSARCPDKPIGETAYVYINTPQSTMCFIPVLAEGACFRADSLHTMFNVVDCTDRSAGAKVVKAANRFDGSTDTALCPTATKPLAYPKPARLYCLTAVTNT